MEVTIGIEDLKERIHNTMKLKILAKEGGKEEKSKMSSDIQNYYKGIPGMIVEEMKQPGTLSNSMMQITTEHTAIIKKVGRNLVKSKNFNRNIRSTLHRTEPEASKEETLAQPTLAIIWYLMSKNITLEETLKMIITNNPTPSCKTNFTEEDRKSMKSSTKRPTRLKPESNKTEKLPQKEKRRRAVNKCDLDSLKEKMETSTIKIKAKGRKLEYKDILLNQGKRKPDYNLTQAVRLAARSTDQNIEVHRTKGAYFTSTVDRKEIEELMEEILKIEEGEDRDQKKEKAKKKALVNWKRYHENKEKSRSAESSTTTCKLCLILTGPTVTFRTRGTKDHQKIHTEFYNIRSEHQNILFPIYSI